MSLKKCVKEHDAGISQRELTALEAVGALAEESLELEEVLT